jgi:SAM-dependent methyltransferase
MLKDSQDAFGHEIYDFYHNQTGFEIVERDDGFFVPSFGPELYFQEYPDWPASEREAIRYAQGKTLDIGCGAGRHSLYLQSQGLEVLGVDNSPLAIEVCKARGLHTTQVCPITQVSRRLGIFDTILMLGNNFALVGNPKRARWLLRRFYHMTTERARIIAQTRDPYQTDLPEHLEYHARNREQGKLSGQARIRIRYKKFVTPWIDFLMVSQDELDAILAGTGWEAREFIEGEGGIYIAILEKRG